MSILSICNEGVIICSNGLKVKFFPDFYCRYLLVQNTGVTLMVISFFDIFFVYNVVSFDIIVSLQLQNGV